MINQKFKDYKYRVYGLNIQSEMELPELIPIADLENETVNIDVNISFGKHHDVRKSFDETIVASVSRENMYVVVDGIAIYQVKNGNEIIIDPNEGVPARRIRSYLLGWSFGILFGQRNIVALHGSALVRDGKGLIIVGQSKAGKSTLSAGLKLKGYNFTSDDVSTISFNEDKLPLVNPAYPQQKLCKEAMDKLGYDVKEFVRSSQNKERVRYVIPANESFINETIPIGIICEICVGDSSKVEIEEIKGGEKIQFLIDNGYFVNIEQKMGMRQKYFKQYLDIAKNISFYRMKRPDNKFTVDEQISVLEEALEGKVS